MFISWWKFKENFKSRIYWCYERSLRFETIDVCFYGITDKNYLINEKLTE